MTIRTRQMEVLNTLLRIRPPHAVLVALLASGCVPTNVHSGARELAAGKSRTVRESTPEETASAKALAVRVRAEQRRAEAAYEAGDYATAEQVYTGEYAVYLTKPLTLLYLDTGQWLKLAALVSAMQRPRLYADEDLNHPVLAIAYYRLGDVENGDQYAPREVADCGVWFTFDRQTQEGDERPNKPVLDSPRKREAAAWHALAVRIVPTTLGERENMRPLNYAEKAARMFPDEPAFCYTYAQALDSAGYATGALEQYERTVRFGRGYFVEGLDETIRVARFHAGKPYDRGRRP